MGKVYVIYGQGKGKTTAAIGRGIKAMSEGEDVSVIQFLKSATEVELLDILKRLEPEMKVFRFEKFNGNFDELSDEQKKEEALNITNGLNFAKKVITTGGSGLVILDEVLGLVDIGYIGVERLIELIDDRPDDVDILLTGTAFFSELKSHVDIITRIEEDK